MIDDQEIIESYRLDKPILMFGMTRTDVYFILGWFLSWIFISIGFNMPILMLVAFGGSALLGVTVAYTKNSSRGGGFSRWVMNFFLKDFYS